MIVEMHEALYVAAGAKAGQPECELEGEGKGFGNVWARGERWVMGASLFRQRQPLLTLVCGVL